MSQRHTFSHIFILSPSGQVPLCVIQIVSLSCYSAVFFLIVLSISIIYLCIIKTSLFQGNQTGQLRQCSSTDSYTISERNNCYSLTQSLLRYNLLVVVNLKIGATLFLTIKKRPRYKSFLS